MRATHVYPDAAEPALRKNYVINATVTDAVGRTNATTAAVRVVTLRGNLGYWARPKSTSDGYATSQWLRFYSEDASTVTERICQRRGEGSTRPGHRYGGQGQ